MATKPTRDGLYWTIFKYKRKGWSYTKFRKKKKLAKEKYYATLRFSLLPATKRKSKKWNPEEKLVYILKKKKKRGGERERKRFGFAKMNTK